MEMHDQVGYPPGRLGSSRKGKEHVDEDSKCRWHLFPGLPDEITVECILTRLPWISLYSLSLVSHAWRKVIHGRLVYEARMRTGTTQALVVAIPVYEGSECAPESPLSAIYDPTCHSWYNLPLLPGASHDYMLEGLQWYTVLDGQLYIIGCWKEDPQSDGVFNGVYEEDLGKRMVYKIDLAACKGIWQRCSRLEVNGDLKCLRYILNEGLIYAFDPVNTELGGNVFSSEKNLWTSTTNMPPRNVGYWQSRRVKSVNGEIFSAYQDGYQVYNPRTSLWRQVKDTLKVPSCVWVVVADKLYNFSVSKVHVYDVASNSWALVQSHRMCLEDQLVSGRGPPMFTVEDIVAVGKELFCWMSIGHKTTPLHVLCKSTNFGQKDLDLVWQILPHYGTNPASHICNSNSLCIAQL